MNKKKKWASILTIATSLILCIISTFGITLAFFGGNASANLSTITLKTGIEIGAAIESSVGSAKVVPGQPVKITATGTVRATTQGTNPDANNAVDGVVRAKFNVGNELGEVTIAGNSTDFWKEGGDGYYYLVTAENGTTLRTVSKGTSVQIFGDLVVSKNFTNADSGKSVEASVIFEVIQAGVYDSVTGNLVELTVANATTSTSPLYSSFEAIEYVEPFTPYYHNEANIATEAVNGIFTLVPIAVASDGADGLYIYYGFGYEGGVAAGYLKNNSRVENLLGEYYCNWYNVESFEIKPMEEYDDLDISRNLYPTRGKSMGILHASNPVAEVNTIIENIEDLTIEILQIDNN